MITREMNRDMNRDRDNNWNIYIYVTRFTGV